MKRLKPIVFTFFLLTSMLSSCKPDSTSTPGGGSNSSIPPSTGTSTPAPKVCLTTGDELSSITSAGKAFVGTVIIAGKRGNDFYVEDPSGSAFVFLNSETKYNSLSIGDLVEIKASVASFPAAGILQLGTVTAMDKIESGCGLKDPSVVTKVSEIDAHRMGRISMGDLKVTSKAITSGASADSKVAATDSSGTAVELFISKRNTNKAAIEEEFASVDVGDKIGVAGAFADFYKIAQIALTSPEQLVKEDMTWEEKVASVERQVVSLLDGTKTRRDLTLPSTGSYSSTISWKSENTKYITDSGKVTRPLDSDVVVKLSYTITLGGRAAASKFITVTVLKFVEGDADYEYTYVEPSYTGKYYTDINSDLRGNSLLLQLDDLLDQADGRNHFSYKGLWEVFQYTDTDPKSGKYYSFYTGELLDKGAGAMNREHVWPNSRGGNFIENDPHMARPAKTADNSGRGNDFYNAAPTSYDPAKLGNPTYRGISARIIFYCAVKAQESGLNLVDLTSDSTGNRSMGKLSTLLEWNLTYDIDQTELQRNDVLFDKYNHNRNPFIDDRNYACKIWGEYNANTKRVCGKH